MLEHITVKGFRSLRDFQLDIKPGLNVLVGPNGAGKTNIILFFEFFRRFANSPLADAVGKAGGVSKIFAKRGKNGFSEKLRGALSGRVEIDGSKYIYTYSFEIEFSLQRQDVYFSSQELLIERHRPTSTGQVLPYFHARCNTQAEPEERLELISIPRGKEGDWMRREAMHMSQRGLLAQHCMTSFVFRSDEVVAAVANDFAGRFVLNVVPGHVKRPEDSTRQPGIESDGSGLTATLFAIKKRRPLYDRYLLPRFRKVPTPPAPKWETVLDLIRVAVPSITDIDVENDPFDNRLRCHITVGTGSKKAVLPLSALSDGTVKWMSLVVRLVTSHDALLLEEPENYLHPLMQREIVRLLRESVHSAGFMIISTHSETLLNAVRPEELVIVNYTADGTKAQRVENSAHIAEEINRTGFGLGYYYLAEAIEVQ